MYSLSLFLTLWIFYTSNPSTSHDPKGERRGRDRERERKGGRGRGRKGERGEGGREKER